MVPHGQAGVPFASVCHYSLVYLPIEWVGLILPTPTAEWSASLEQPCRKVMVTPLVYLPNDFVICLSVKIRPMKRFASNYYQKHKKMEGKLEPRELEVFRALYDWCYTTAQKNDKR